MTVKKAKAQSKKLPGCRGFCFEGIDTGRPLKIFFKDSWEVDATSTRWTTYRVNPTPNLIVSAPHLNASDPIMLISCFPPGIAFMASVEMLNGISGNLVGRCMDALQTIYIDRFQPESRQTAKEVLKKRGKAEWTGVKTGLFPEGTTTNGKSLIQFKVGAFLPGEPIQLVVMSYPNKFLPLSYTGEARGTLQLFRMMTQFINHCHVTLLDPYVPSPAEIADANLYANNVRRYLADFIGIPCSEHSVEDSALANAGLGMKVGNQRENDFVVREAVLKYGMTSDQMKVWLKEFGQFDQTGSGFISLTEFRQAILSFAEKGLAGFAILVKLAASLRANKGVFVDEIFTLFNTDRSGQLSFREFVQALAVLSDTGSAKLEGRVKLCFLLCNPSPLGYVPKAFFEGIVRDPASDLPASILQEMPDQVKFGLFLELARSHPALLQAVIRVPEV